MTVYTVHLDRHLDRHAADPDRAVVLVPEGFSWPALLFTVLWAAWHRLWAVAFAGLVIEGAAAALATLIGPAEAAIVALHVAVTLGFGAFGNDLRRLALTRRGYETVGVVHAPGADASLARFLDHYPEVAAAIGGGAEIKA